MDCGNVIKLHSIELTCQNCIPRCIYCGFSIKEMVVFKGCQYEYCLECFESYFDLKIGTNELTLFSVNQCL